MDSIETKKNIIKAGRTAIEELIKVAKEKIVDSGEDITADRLKNAAATKKLAIFDAFEILSRIEEEEKFINQSEDKTEQKKFKGFAEGRSK
jgi:ASC-1-like (ASCH) protein